MDDDYVRAVMTFFVRLWNARVDLPCEPDRELVPVPPDGDLRPRGRPRREGRHAVHDPLPVRGRRRARGRLDRDRTSGDDPRRRRRCGASGRPALQRRDRAGGLVPYTELRVPVLADERIDREFGTGALKVTPGHDPLDFEIGRDHGLAEPMAVGWDGRMSDAAGDLAGSPRRRRARACSRGRKSAACSRRGSRTATRSARASAATRASSR